MSGIDLSIVIPTHNRRDPCLRLIAALDRQELGAGAREVVVVADGCTAGTAAAIRSSQWRHPVSVIEQPASGPSIARNRGGAHARGRVLLFLDDDIEPAPGLIAAHRAFHDAHANAVAIGELRPSVKEGGFFGLALRGWLETMYDGMRRPGHRYAYRDLLSGHVSIARDAFQTIGAFDPTLRCHEDWELGYRVLKSGMTMRFVPEAIAVNHDATNLDKAIARKVDEGMADVQLVGRYPELAPDLPLSYAKSTSRTAGLLRHLAWLNRPAGDALARAIRASLAAYEAARLRFRWRAAVEELFGYAYWCGVARAVGTRRKLRGLLEPSGAEQARPLHSAPAGGTPNAGGAPDLIVDLTHGIDAVCARVDAARPRSLRIMFAGRRVGELADRPGAERLRGEHVPAIVTCRFAFQALCAAARAGALPPPLTPVPRHFAARV